MQGIKDSHFKNMCSLACPRWRVNTPFLLPGILQFLLFQILLHLCLLTSPSQFFFKLEPLLCQLFLQSYFLFNVPHPLNFRLFLVGWKEYLDTYLFKKCQGKVQTENPCQKRKNRVSTCLYSSETFLTSMRSQEFAESKAAKGKQERQGLGTENGT